MTQQGIHDGLFKEELDNKALDKLIEYINKLERIVEVTEEYREAIKDAYCTASEENYVLDKLDEAFEEYEIFINNMEEQK